MEHPRTIDIDLFNAQQTRRILDRLVGYKLSPFLWRTVRRGLSAGRVQSVAVRLIDDREKEIEALKYLQSLENNRFEQEKLDSDLIYKAIEYILK